MEERTENQQSEPEKKEEGYTPRPAWQVWGARIALVVFIILVISQIISIAQGGL